MVSEEARLNRDDLFLMMKSYENTIRLNTTLLEKQNLLLSQHDVIIEKEKELYENNNKLIEELSNLILSVKNDISAINKQVTNIQIKSVENNSAIKISLVYVYVGIITAVGTLVTILYNSWSRFYLIEDIAKKLGVM